MELGKVYVDSVIIGERHRALVPATVNALAESMDAIGLQHPISVYVDDNDAAYLIAGHHRLEAARKLGWEEIDATFCKMDVIDRELWEIAENLYRADLSKEARDEHIRRYAELLIAREAARLGTQNANQPPAVLADGRPKGPQHQKSISRKVAEETGLSIDTVKRARGERVDPPRPVRVAADPLNDFETLEAQVASLMAAWNKASREARDEFLLRIDRPVFDNTRAA